MEFRGFFTLQTPADLLFKLRHDYARLLANRVDSYAAFDFFVTAEHLLDWQYPGRARRSDREERRSAEALLRITSHIANGGKHFKVESRQHDSAEGFRLIEQSVVCPFTFPVTFEAAALLIELGDDRPDDLGEDVEVTALALRLLQYWEGVIGVVASVKQRYRAERHKLHSGREACARLLIPNTLGVPQWPRPRRPRPPASRPIAHSTNSSMNSRTSLTAQP